MLIDLPSLELKSVVHNLLVDSGLSEQQYICIESTLKKLPKINIGRPLVVCHGDVNFSNVIFGKNTYLVDFECACKAEAEYDLAMMIAINLLNKSQQSTLLTTYEINNSIKPCYDRLSSYLPYCYLINGLWYLLKYREEGHSKYYQLAQKQFSAFDFLCSYNE